MNPDVRARRKLGLVLIPELGRLLGDFPGVLHVARREVALLGSATLFIRAHAGNDAREGLCVRVPLVRTGGVIEPVARPLARQCLLQRFRLEQTAAGDAIDRTGGKRPLRIERGAVFAIDQVEIPLGRQDDRDKRSFQES
jgi:hypothetical protein